MDYHTEQSSVTGSGQASVIRQRSARWILIALLGARCAAPLGAAAGRDVSLAWDPSPSPNISGYILKYGTRSHDYTGSILVAGARTTGTVPDLDLGQRYYFVVAALNEFGTEGHPSAEISYPVPATPVWNYAPTLASINTVRLSTDAGQSTVTLSGIGTGSPDENQALEITATSSNPYLLPDPAVSYVNGESTGTLTLTPRNQATGFATVQITVNDGASLNNITTRTFVVIVTSAQGRYVKYKEAESGTVDNFMLSDLHESAENGEFVFSEHPGQGRLSVTFDVPVGANYILWCRVLAPNNGTDSFFISLNDGPEEVYHTAPGSWSPHWQWSLFRTSSLTGPRVFKLNPGQHTFHFRAREAYTLLDALYLTGDRSFVPLSLNVLPPASPGAGSRINFMATPGYHYKLQATEDFQTWETIWTTDVIRSPEQLDFTDKFESARGRRFYRVQILGGLEPFGSVK